MPWPGAGLWCEILSMHSCGGIERIVCNDRIPRRAEMSDLWVIHALNQDNQCSNRCVTVGHKLLGKCCGSIFKHLSWDFRSGIYSCFMRAAHIKCLLPIEYPWNIPNHHIPRYFIPPYQLQGLVNVPFWEYWTSPYSSHYRPYTQWLGDVQWGHSMTHELWT